MAGEEGKSSSRKMHDNKRISAFAALIAGVVSISWSAIFVRWTDMPGTASAFYRVLIASIALWAILLVRRGVRLRIPLRVIPLSVLAGIFFAGDVGFYNVAVLHTSAGNATFLGSNAPVLVGLLTWFMTRKLPSARFWTALAIALAGGCLIVWGDWASSAGIWSDWIHMRSASSADLMAIATSVCFALYLLATERLRINSDTATIVVLSTSASALTLLVFALCVHIPLSVPHIHSFFAVAGLGLICQLAGYFSLTYALGHVPATISSVVMLGVAPLTAVLAYFIFGEAMTVREIFGGALTLVAVWIVTREPRISPGEA
jgi:drug/metabolite transporter (DMT)-like permease